MEQVGTTKVFRAKKNSNLERKLYNFRGDKMLDRPNKNAVEASEIYTLLALLHYVRKELTSIDEFSEYFVDMAIYQLSQHLPSTHAGESEGQK